MRYKELLEALKEAERRKATVDSLESAIYWYGREGSMWSEKTKQEMALALDRAQADYNDIIP